MAVLESGELKGKKIGIDLAHLARGAHQLHESSSRATRFRARLLDVHEIAALDKHACPACGAQAEWNPAKQKLVCPFCGTESPYQIDRADRHRSSSSIS